MRLHLIVLVFVAFGIQTAVAQDTRYLEAAKLKPAEELKLWPGNAPDEKGNIGEEKAEAGNETPPIIRVSNVSVPTMSFYPAKTDSTKNACVVIFPGGGYSILAYDYEGIEVAQWLNENGISAVVCKYRVPRRAGQPKHLAPLQDAQRAMRLTRENAEKWKLDPDKIGVLGFSAGGHLTVMAATAYDERVYEPIDAADELSAKPNFALPIYPAYILGEDNKTWNKAETPFAEEIKITKDTPPFFMSIADDDPIGSMGAVKAYIKMRELDIPCELHIFVKGGHGYGLRHKNGRAATWDDLAAGWLKTFVLQE